MKHFTILFLVTIFLFGCSSSDSPKQTVSNFVIAIKKLDFQKAQKMVTDETRSIVGESQIVFKNSPDFQDEMTKSKSLTDDDIIKKLGLNNLTETIVDKNATVLTKDSLNQIQLEKVGGTWKIVCHSNLVMDILFEDRNREVVNSDYQTLRSNYNRREDLIRAMAVQASAPDSNLNPLKNKIQEIKSVSPDISNSLAYIAKENELTDLLSNYLKTTSLRNDMATYFEGTANRIAVARNNLRQAVSNYNRGFGQKMHLLPEDENVKNTQIEF